MGIKLGRPIVHGYTVNGKPTSEWLAWKSMKSRCTNSKRRDFGDYGGRGICVCDR